MKYKVGDRVRINSLDWYNQNKDEDGNIDINYDFTFYADRSKYCGKVFTIAEVFDNCYTVKEDNNEYYWIDEMIECLVEEKSSIDLTVKGDEVKERIEITIPEGYEYVIESGKIIFTKKKKEYPKTYEECHDMLDDTNKINVFDICKFAQLLEARNAYWKIAGDEMGLGKPWEPDYKNPDIDLYVIINIYNQVEKAKYGYGFQQCVFTFPTAEMRDAFKENFDPDIEICKEFL